MAVRHQRALIEIGRGAIGRSIAATVHGRRHRVGVRHAEVVAELMSNHKDVPVLRGVVGKRRWEEPREIRRNSIAEVRAKSGRVGDTAAEASPRKHVRGVTNDRALGRPDAAKLHELCGCARRCPHIVDLRPKPEIRGTDANAEVSAVNRVQRRSQRGDIVGGGGNVAAEKLEEFEVGVEGNPHLATRHAGNAALGERVAALGNIAVDGGADPRGCFDEARGQRREIKRHRGQPARLWPAGNDVGVAVPLDEAEGARVGHGEKRLRVGHACDRAAKKRAGGPQRSPLEWHGAATGDF